MFFPSQSQIYSLDSLDSVDGALNMLTSGSYTLTITANAKDADRMLLQLNFDA